MKQALYQTEINRSGEREGCGESFSAASRCFCCFCRKLSATDIAFAAEILGSWRREARQNSGTGAAAR
jgi:hypothetical protein